MQRTIRKAVKRRKNRTDQVVPTKEATRKD